MGFRFIPLSPETSGMALRCASETADLMGLKWNLAEVVQAAVFWASGDGFRSGSADRGLDGCVV